MTRMTGFVVDRKEINNQILFDSSNTFEELFDYLDDILNGSPAKMLDSIVTYNIDKLDCCKEIIIDFCAIEKISKEIIYLKGLNKGCAAQSIPRFFKHNLTFKIEIKRK